MDSQPEVSSTMTEDAEVVIEIEVSPSRNGISLAEAANALITLQVPSKDNSAVHSPKVGEDQKVSADDINPKDVRKKILEGMKSQFNTNAEEDVVQEQTSRRGPHRSKSKFKLHEYDNDDDSVDVGTKPDNPKQSRGRGRPPRLIPPHDKSTLMTNGVKIEPSGKSEKDSSSEAGSERGDSLSISSGAITTRRSQRANISRTSATDLLKGLTDSRTARKHIASPDADVNKSQDPPRKRGRPSKSATPVDSKVESVQADPDPVVLVTEPVEERRPEDDVSKVEHMASLGLLSKANTELSILLTKLMIPLLSNFCSSYRRSIT